MSVDELSVNSFPWHSGACISLLVSSREEGNDINPM